MKNQFFIGRLKIIGKLPLVCLIAIAFAFSGTPGRAQLPQQIFAHLGQNDPTTEGFSLYLPGPPNFPDSVGGGNDGVSNFWEISGNGASGYYTATLPTSAFADPSGWTVTASEAVISAYNSNGGNNNNFVAVVDGTNAWIIILEGGPNDPASVQGLYADDENLNLLQLSSAMDPTRGYHIYQMVYNPATQAVSYYIDGISIATLTRSQVFPLNKTFLQWGDGTGGNGLSDTKYALVELQTGQHPIMAAVQHIGLNCPTCEGWTFVQNGAAILSSDNDGEDFWRVQQTNATAYYLCDLTSSYLTDAGGWTATMQARVNTANGLAQNSYLGVMDGANEWVLNLGGGPGVPSNATGVFTYNPQSAFVQLGSMDPSTGYHIYQLVYNPAGEGGSGSVTYWVDGIVIATVPRVQAPFNTTQQRIEFGDGSSGGGNSDVQYSLVRFETGQHGVPELVLSQSGAQLTLSWAASGFILQTNSNLSDSSGWADWPAGTNSPTVVNAGQRSLFFRLRQQQ